MVNNTYCTSYVMRLVTLCPPPIDKSCLFWLSAAWYRVRIIRTAAWCIVPRAGSGVVGIDPVHFLTGCRKRQLKQALSLLSLSIGFFSVLLLFIGPLFVLTLVCICVCSVSWLFWLSCQYLPSDGLERLLWGSLFMLKRYLQKAPSKEHLWLFSFWVLFQLFYCLLVLLPALHNIFILLSHGSQFVLKVPLNTN